jgi:hydrogenase nickel incorporation protein HypB
MFEIADVLLINKIDVIDIFDFDIEKVKKRARRLNPDIKIFPISARTGEGIKEWTNWLRSAVKLAQESN